MSKSEKIEKLILKLSFGASAVFVIIEFFMAVYSHSQSVLMDAAYDASELFIIALTLFLTPLFYKPVSEKRPFGYAQVESIFIIIKGFMLLSVSLSLSINSIQMALSGGNQVDGGMVSVFQLFLGVVSLVILLIMKYLNRSITSLTVDAEIYGWKIDVAYSLGMSLAFFVSTMLYKTPLNFITPYFDQVIAVLVVAFMLPGTLKMMLRAIKDVFLFSPEKEIMDEIKGICNHILKEFKFHAVFYDVTRTGRRIWVSIYFKIDSENLNMDRLNEATEQINTALAEKFDNCSGELIVSAEEDE